MTLTAGDTAPTLTGAVNADLTGATATAHIRRSNGTVISRAVTVTDAETGAWSVDLQTGDLTSAGDYQVEVQVTFSNGKIQTFSNGTDGKQITFTVRPQIA